MMKCKKVFDLATFVPMDNRKSFFLDTNVLYWFFYPRYGITKNSHVKLQAAPYYDFIDKLVSNGNPLFTSIYNITEMIHVIEKNEFDLYKMSHPEADYTIKDFRRIPNERNQLKRNLTTALASVRSTCTILEFNFTYDILDQFVINLEDHHCDPFDYAILTNCIKENNINIISDDSDFSTMGQICLYTANATSLANSIAKA